MPTIKKQAPLLPEGEYCGQAKKVTMEWSKPKPQADGTKSESVQIFRIPLFIPGGQIITTFARVMDSTGWVFEQICKSGDLILPEGEEFVITADDLENRKFYFGVQHTTYKGTTVANVRFHTKTYACEVNPALENVSFPNEAPRGITLRSAKPPVNPEQPSPGAAPVSNQPAPTQPPVVGATKAEELEDLSDTEFQEALEHVKKLREKRE